MLVQGAGAAYVVDPTDAEFASDADAAFLNRADRALAFIIANQAKTLEGISAKAAIVRSMLGHGNRLMKPLYPREVEFLQKLAEEVVIWQKAQSISGDPRASRDRQEALIQ
jgi:hypothetical protein